MNQRAQLDAELRHMARMLPPWCEHLRDPAQFWPQFTRLAGEILARADHRDQAYARRVLDALLARNGMRAGTRRHHH